MVGRLLGQAPRQRIDCVRGPQWIAVVDDVIDDVPQRFQAGVTRSAVASVGSAFGAHRPIERGQVGILAHQPVQLVEHSLEAIDDIIGLRRGGPQSWGCDLIKRDSYFRSPTGRIVTQWPYTELEYARRTWRVRSREWLHRTGIARATAKPISYRAGSSATSMSPAAAAARS